MRHHLRLLLIATIPPLGIYAWADAHHPHRHHLTPASRPPPTRTLQVSTSEENKYLLHQAQIIDELEATVPSWLERRCPHWYPAYVMALVLQPTDKESVTLAETSWPGSSANPYLDQLPAPEGEAGVEVEAVERTVPLIGELMERNSSMASLEAQVQVLARQVERLTAALQASGAGGVAAVATGAGGARSASRSSSTRGM
jgi:hypothetical protein